MELKTLANYYKLNIKILVISVLLGLILGIIFYYSPKTYYTTGTLYSNSKVDEDNNTYFNYDGYYAQQTAVNYTTTVMAALESKSVITKVLEKMDITTTDKNIKKLQRNIKVTKESPQIIKITVKGKDEKTSKEVWENLVNITKEELNKINDASGDKSLSINTLGNNSVTNSYYYSIYLCIIVSSIINLAVALFYLTLKLYLKEEK